MPAVAPNCSPNSGKRTNSVILQYGLVMLARHMQDSPVRVIQHLYALGMHWVSLGFGGSHGILTMTLTIILNPATSEPVDKPGRHLLKRQCPNYQRTRNKCNILLHGQVII